MGGARFGRAGGDSRDSGGIERVGVHTSRRSEVGRVTGSSGATRWTPGPEKSDGPCEGPLGFGTAKAVVTSGGIRERKIDKVP